MFLKVKKFNYSLELEKEIIINTEQICCIYYNSLLMKHEVVLSHGDNDHVDNIVPVSKEEAQKIFNVIGVSL